MEGNSVISQWKRPNDLAGDRSDSGESAGKRRKPHGEAVFRLLCPSDKSGAVIGKGGSSIRHLRELTGAKIRIDDPLPGCDERVILVAAAASDAATGDDAPSPAQMALMRVFEKMMRADDDRWEREGVVCRMLAPSNHVGCVLGKGGKIVEKMRIESGAQIRILAKDQMPPCAVPGDELIQITGSFSSVKKALLSVSSCLQDNPRSDSNNFVGNKSLGLMQRVPGLLAQADPFPQRGYMNGFHAADYHSRGHSMFPQENVSTSQRNFFEEEVAFRLLCSNDKVGSLIGKGGAVVRGLQNETGALIKIQEAVPDSDERVVLITALENSELEHSPAQDAVIRVHSKIIEIGAEKVSSVPARLLVPAQQIGCLLGKGGTIIAEMRRATGANIKIYVNEHVPKCASLNDEVVQVSGSLQSVQDALFHITTRLRETIIPMRPNPNFGTAYSASAPEISPIVFRHRHEPLSPGHYSSSAGFSHGLDRSASFPKMMERQLVHSHSMDRIGLTNVDCTPHPYRSEMSGHAYGSERPSPRSRAPQAAGSPNPFTSDVGAGLAPGGGVSGSGSEEAVLKSTSIEVVVPKQLLGLIYGENDSDLNQIREMSGAKVVVHDPSPGATEGNIIISGTPDQTRVAQCLLHAFILCGQNSP